MTALGKLLQIAGFIVIAVSVGACAGDVATAATGWIGSASGFLLMMLGRALDWLIH